LPDHLAPQGQRDQRVIQAPRQNPNSKTLGIGPPQLAAIAIGTGKPRRITAISRI
jgi:hypothetical protein